MTNQTASTATTTGDRAKRVVIKMSDRWHCEECGEPQDDQPASVEKYPGVEGPVELWFCPECTRHER